MEKHPGGREYTRRLVELAGLTPPLSVLDMGAGEGDAVRYLRSLGFDARGMDLDPGRDVEKGDFLRCPYPEGSFGAVISQCAFFVSGDAAGAYREAHRLLSSGGRLLVSDVTFSGTEGAAKIAEDAGFRVLRAEDHTPAWREYYIECIWNGTAETLCKSVPGGRCGYYLMVCEREA